MKKKSLLIALAPVLLLGLQPDDSRSRGVIASHPSAISEDDLKPTITQEKVEAYVTKIFSGYHYRKFGLNDSLSNKMYENYLNEIDRAKLYFLASDVQSFEKYRNQLDESLSNGDLTAAYDMYNTCLLYTSRCV